MGWDAKLTFLGWGSKFKQHRQLFQSKFTQCNIVHYRPLQEREARIATCRMMNRSDQWKDITNRFSSAIVLNIGFGATIDADNHPYLKLEEVGNFSTTKEGSPTSTIIDYFPCGELLESHCVGVS